MYIFLQCVTGLSNCLLTVKVSVIIHVTIALPLFAQQNKLTVNIKALINQLNIPALPPPPSLIQPTPPSSTLLHSPSLTQPNPPLPPPPSLTQPTPPSSTLPHPTHPSLLHPPLPNPPPKQYMLLQNSISLTLWPWNLTPSTAFVIEFNRPFFTLALVGAFKRQV